MKAGRVWPMAGSYQQCWKRRCPGPCFFLKRGFFLARRTTIKYIRSVMIKTPLIISAKVLDESAFPTIIAGAEIGDA